MILRDLTVIDLKVNVKLFLIFLINTPNIEVFVMIFIDIDECQESTSGCTQRCDNTEGSFVCSCVPGFTLNTDNKTCSPTGIIKMSLYSKNGFKAYLSTNRYIRIR